MAETWLPERIGVWEKIWMMMKIEINISNITKKGTGVGWWWQRWWSTVASHTTPDIHWDLTLSQLGKIFSSFYILHTFVVMIWVLFSHFLSGKEWSFGHVWKWLPSHLSVKADILFLADTTKPRLRMLATNGKKYN